MIANCTGKRSRIKAVFFCLKVLFLFMGIGKLIAQKINIEPSNYAEKVNTQIGYKGKGFGVNELYLEAGFTFPGAMYPFGMVQFTPTFFDEGKGFVVNQLSGAGCRHMGNFPTLPLTGELKVSPDNMMNLPVTFNIQKAVAGYFNVKLGNGINCELSATKRTGIVKYTYPSSESLATVIIGSGINATSIKDAGIKITSSHTCEGYADGGDFCGIKTNYKVYFVAEFDNSAVAFGTWKHNQLNKNLRSATGDNSGAYFTFDVSQQKNIQYKFAISYVSIENARQNLQSENSSWNFGVVKKEAQQAWNNYLGKIKVTGGSNDLTTQFYTHLYHVFAHPSLFSDVNGDYIGADNKVHVTKRNCYTAFSNWDTYRTQIQLISLLAPEETSDMITSLIYFASQSGEGLPRWVLANIETGIMQGDPSAILIANAYAFGARKFDIRKALSIMRKGAEIPGTGSQGIETRPYLESYLKHGYINASMQLEYTSSDFAIGKFALKALKDSSLYSRYLHRAQSWKNLYNPSTTWMQSRNEDGSWKNQEVDWREASYKNYFWMVPYNLKGLIDTIGGKQVAETRLDSFFMKLNADYSQQWFASGNEPDFQVPWVYNWAGAPYKTQSLIKRIIKEQYKNKDNGLPGNDDLGAMGAWYVFANIGLYPMIPGEGGFTINSPSFSSVKIYLPRGKIINISGGSEKLPYITSLRVNGKVWNKTWIPLSQLENGGSIQFSLSALPEKKWGINQEPPSFNR